MQLLGYFIFYYTVANERATVMDASCQKAYWWSTNPIYNHTKDYLAIMLVMQCSLDSTTNSQSFPVKPGPQYKIFADSSLDSLSISVLRKTSPVYI